MFRSTKTDGYSQFEDQEVIGNVDNGSLINEKEVRPPRTAIAQQPQQASGSSSGPDPGFRPVLPFISQQPGTGPQHIEWMRLPATSANCSPGLSYLHELDRWLVQYQVELFNISRNYGIAHKFSVKNSFGQAAYMIGLVEDFVAGSCCKPSQLREGRTYDVNEAEIIHFSWSDQCKCCCCCSMPGYLNTIGVESPPGQSLAMIKQSSSMEHPHFDVMDYTGRTILTVQGSSGFRINLENPTDIIFEIISADKGFTIGKMVKHWSGKNGDAYQDCFDTQVPGDLDVSLKAAILSLAVFIVGQGMRQTCFYLRNMLLT